MNEENKERVSHWKLYVLKLEQDKYYVGITTKTPEIRMQEHARGRGAYWTMRYKPLKVIDSVDLGRVTKLHAEEYENKVTRKYIKERGLNNVRGGDLTADEEYLARFGRAFTKDNWQVVTVVGFMMLALVYLTIDKYFF